MDSSLVLILLALVVFFFVILPWLKRQNDKSRDLLAKLLDVDSHDLYGLGPEAKKGLQDRVSSIKRGLETERSRLVDQVGIAQRAQLGQVHKRLNEIDQTLRDISFIRTHYLSAD